MTHIGKQFYNYIEFEFDLLWDEITYKNNFNLIRSIRKQLRYLNYYRVFVFNLKEEL